MDNPLEERRRCWTLHYADGAQFHMDIVPALPDAQRYQVMLKEHGYGVLAGNTTLTGRAIAITDRTLPQYTVLTDDWPQSNPMGYAAWFRGRMTIQLTERKEAFAKHQMITASVDDIPDYKVKTPLQRAIQLLKRHRDCMFAEDGEHKPISIIITTLAAHAYNEEPTISAALRIILTGMEDHIGYRGDEAWVPNPVNPAENFADKWAEEPKKRETFYTWLEQARGDFAQYLRGQPLRHRAGRFEGETWGRSRGADTERYSAGHCRPGRSSNCPRARPATTKCSGLRPQSTNSNGQEHSQSLGHGHRSIEETDPGGGERPRLRLINQICGRRPEGADIYVRGSYLLFENGSVSNPAGPITQFDIAMVLVPGFSHREPKVFEVGGRIPRCADRHINPDGDCCVTVWEHWLASADDHSFASFLNGPVHEYFLGQYWCERTGKWPFGERAHGLRGLEEAYADALGLCSVRSGNLGSPRAGVYPGAGRSVILVIHESVQTNMENQYAERPG